MIDTSSSMLFYEIKSVSEFFSLKKIKTFLLKSIHFLLIVFFRSWIKKIDGIENIDLKRPVIFVANHRSYFDFILLGAIFTKNVVFLAEKKISKTFFIKYLAKFYEVIYIDRDNPGLSFFKKLIKCIEDGKSIIIFPEGTRSRSGKMLLPKIGFVKLAMLTTTPIVPVAIKGTYEILPPHKVLPKFKKCEIVFCKKFYISPDNSEFKDIFLKKGIKKFSKLTKEDLQKIAIRVMEKIRVLTNEEWDETALKKINESRIF